VSLRLYDYAASGNCYKVRLLLALLGRDYERVAVDIFAGETLSSDFARLNPARETPVLQLEDGSILTQSNAILWHLAAGSQYLPEGALEQSQVLQWLFFEAERVSGIAGARFRTLTGRGLETIAARFALGETALALLEIHLKGRSFLVGRDCTIADISNFAYTHVASEAGYDMGSYSAVMAWIERVQGQPGFINDLLPYPENAKPGQSNSIYD
jgi:glutathione S-transferase